MECPNCSAPLPTAKAKFCPRCGFVLPPELKPIHLEKRGTLINPFFAASVALVVCGALLAVEGTSRIGILVLAIGVPLLVVSTIRSVGR
jgi:hypothetical protein